MGLIDKLFGTYSDRQIKKILPLVEQIEALSDHYKSMEDSELRGMTAVLKKRNNL